jgi:hypothetical protein
MPHIPLDMIRIILEYTPAHLHQVIIDACSFTPSTAREYGALSTMDIATGVCFKVSPRHASQVYSTYTSDIPIAVVDAMLMMLISRKGYAYMNSLSSGIVNRYLLECSHEIGRMAMNGEMFETYYTMGTYQATAPIEMYSPTRYHYIARHTTLSRYVQVRGSPPSEVYWLLLTAIERGWDLGDNVKGMMSSFTMQQMNDVGDRLSKKERKKANGIWSR